MLKRSPLGSDFYQKKISNRGILGEFYNVSHDIGGPTGVYEGLQSCYLTWSESSVSIAAFKVEAAAALNGLGYRKTGSRSDRLGYLVDTYVGPQGALDVIGTQYSADSSPSLYFIAKR